MLTYNLKKHSKWPALQRDNVYIYSWKIHAFTQLDVRKRTQSHIHTLTPNKAVE